MPACYSWHYRSLSDIGAAEDPGRGMTSGWDSNRSNFPENYHCPIGLNRSKPGHSLMVPVDLDDLDMCLKAVVPDSLVGNSQIADSHVANSLVVNSPVAIDRAANSLGVLVKMG